MTHMESPRRPGSDDEAKYDMERPRLAGTDDKLNEARYDLARPRLAGTEKTTCKKTLIEQHIPEWETLGPAHGAPQPGRNPPGRPGEPALSGSNVKANCKRTLLEADFSNLRKRKYVAKTMLDRRAIADMVEKHERAKLEREANCADAEIDKELEDKISAEFLDNFPAEQSVSSEQGAGRRISIAWLILATLILLAFWALPA
ncbi:MAG: hypothetical protein EKK48_16015 [Candidatus Melainabacteria bacterium]|nr:MAG: hypothetical protein EKK48_16015 [Candidatus Melainabacteria bacterium]